MCVVGEWFGDTGDEAFTWQLLDSFCLVQRVPLPNWTDSAHELTVWERRVAGSRGGGMKAEKKQDTVAGTAHLPKPLHVSYLMLY